MLFHPPLGVPFFLLVEPLGLPALCVGSSTAAFLGSDVLAELLTPRLAGLVSSGMRILLAIDIHFCQFANFANAIKADKLPLVVELQTRRLVDGDTNSGEEILESFFLACAGIKTYLVQDWGLWFWG